MKKNIIILGTLLLSGVFYSQVGVNIDSPKSTFDVSAKRAANGTITDNTQILGLQAPRVTRAELTSNTATYGTDQKGALIYVTDISGGTNAGSRINIDATGYYYFDGSLWIKVGFGTEPWQIQGTTNPATTNAQNIYQNGSVAIGIASGTSIPSAEVTATNPKLYVAGNVSSTGSYYTTTGKYADYVFEDYFDGRSKIDENYKFKTLKEVSDYIKINKHLPGVTAITDIAKTQNGYNVNLSELSIQQLEKIEELYLHTIEQQEEISRQKAEINALQYRLEKLEQRVTKKGDSK
jgi:hypothetical protein